MMAHCLKVAKKWAVWYLVKNKSIIILQNNVIALAFSVKCITMAFTIFFVDNDILTNLYRCRCSHSMANTDKAKRWEEYNQYFE